jgi:hypothetical protein
VITHNYTIMCDEVRREDNGKFLLVGVYLDTILFNSLPWTVPGVTFFMKLHCDVPGTYGMNMRLEKMEGGEPLFTAEGALNSMQRGSMYIPFRTPAIKFEQVGGYNFVVEIEGSEPILCSFSADLPPKPFPVS